MKIACFDQDIRKLLETGYYRIPRFQRPYSWDRDNVEEFWEDVVESEQGDYFIGSIVVFKKNNYLYLVDGQQRLTTITILLACLRDKFSEIGFEKLANGVQGLIERKNLDDESEFVISPETSYPYFQDHIQSAENPSTKADIGEEEALLKDSYDYLLGKVGESMAGKTKEKAKNGLSSIRNKVLSLKVIFVEVDNEDDAYVIFETLNTRGKDLATSDLLKNHLARLWKKNNTNLDPMRIAWDRVCENVDGLTADVRVDDFLHHYWIASQEFTTKRELFGLIREFVSKENVKKFVNDLAEASDDYRLIYDPTSFDWPKEKIRIRDSLESLSNVFRVRLPIPMVLALLIEMRRGNISKKQPRELCLQ